MKIMCQALVLGWLDCLCTMCRTKTETLAVARDLHFLLEGQMGLKLFAHHLCTNVSNGHIYFIMFGVTEVY